MSVRTFITSLAAAGCLAVLVPAVAGASTASISNGQLHYTAAAGEANALTLSPNDDFVVLSDPNALITHGPGCFKGAPSHTVACGAASVTGAAIALGDLADTLTVDAGFPLPVTAHGGAGNDTLHGGALADSLFGDADADTFDGGSAGDVIDGGTGIDTADYSTRKQSVFVHLDGVANDGGALEKDNVAGNVEKILGSGDGDLLEGNANANTLVGNGGDDSLQGFGGADVLNGGVGTDSVRYEDRTGAVNVSLDGVANDGAAGEGDNAIADENIFGGGGGDTLTGNASGNALVGNGGSDTLHGLGGTDHLLGEAGADVIDGGDGEDVVSFGNETAGVTVTLDGVANDGQPSEHDNVNPNVEDVLGSDFDDHLIGNGLANVINGREGDDVLEGRSGNDTLFGELGADTLIGGVGNDSLQGGADRDTASYEDHTADVTALVGAKAISGGTETDTLNPDVENLTGGSGNDTLIGDAQSNGLIGGKGVDSLDGAGASDRIEAADGVADHITCDPFDILVLDILDSKTGC